MKNSNYIIGNRTRDLLACGAVPQPTATTRNPHLVWPRLIREMSIQKHATFIVGQKGPTQQVPSKRLRSSTNLNDATHQKNQILSLTVLVVYVSVTSKQFIFRKIAVHLPLCRLFKADSHIACRAHAVPMSRPCRSHAAPMPFPCHAVPLRV